MKTVLLIEDDKSIRTTLKHVLRQGGWRVLEAEDGEQGLKMAEQAHPEIVLCDLLMPRCNGYEVCRTLRQQPQFEQTKIIVTTGSSYPTDRLNALQAGAHEYIVKPVNPQKLFETMAELTGGKRVQIHRQADGASSPPALGELPGDRSARLKFWGVRGSIPTPGPDTVYYGGNTSCVEVRADGEILILDAGTGIRLLGTQLENEFKNLPLHLTLLMSHTHWDHIQGFPFFVPAYKPRNQVRILGYEGARKGLESVFSSQMESPYFPITMRQMPGNIHIEELKELEFTVGKVQVQAAFVNHPGICVGYRLLTSEGSIAYLPDNEPFQGLIHHGNSADGSGPEARDFARHQDKKLVEFIRRTDVLIIDAQYDAEEYRRHRGWGHGCVDDVVSLASQAEVKQLFLFHHDPGHNDEKISHMVAQGRALAASHGSNMIVEAAREGLEVALQPAAAPAACDLTNK